MHDLYRTYPTQETCPTGTVVDHVGYTAPTRQHYKLDHRAEQE